MAHPSLKECPYCHGPVRFSLDSSFLAGKQLGPIWYCGPCEAWTCTYPRSPGFRPIGRLANATLREAHARCNALFDSLWTPKHIGNFKNKPPLSSTAKHKAKQRVWKWFADRLDVLRTHADGGRVEMLDLDQCQAFLALEADYHAAHASPSGAPRTTMPVAVRNGFVESLLHAVNHTRDD